MSTIIVLDTDVHKHRLIAANERAQQLNLLAEDAGWNDLLGEFIDRTSGTDRPTLATLFGGHHMLVWSRTALNQTTVNWHLRHDYKPGSAVYPHIHFRPTGNLAGDVHWRFILSATKGHGQTSGIPAATTIDLIFPIPANSMGTHFVAEIPSPGWYTEELEWDTVIHCTVQRRADLATDTHEATVAAWQADLHYQVGRIATPARLPPFI